MTILVAYCLRCNGGKGGYLVHTAQAQEDPGARTELFKFAAAHDVLAHESKLGAGEGGPRFEVVEFVPRERRRRAPVAKRSPRPKGGK